MSLHRYPAYKSSGIDWLGDIPEHWDVAPIKRFFSVALGKMLQPEKTSDDDKLCPYVRAASIQWSGILAEEVKSMWFSPRERTQLALLHGDLLVSEGGDAGRSAIWKSELEECYFQNSVNRVRSYGECLNEFLYYWMYSLKNRGYIDVVCSKSTIMHYTAEKVAATPFPVPSEAEQSVIVAFLNYETAKIDSLVAEQERLIALLKEKRQAVISHAVTKGLDPTVPMKDSGVEWLGEVPAHWSITRAGRYASVLPGYAFPSSGFTDNPQHTRLLRGINVGVGEVRWDETVTWERTQDDGLDRFALEPGDLVIGMDRPFIGGGTRVAILREEDVPSLLLQRVALIRPGEALASEYFYYLISSDFFGCHVAPEMTGVSVPHISGEQIEGFEVPLPPLEEQQAICAYLADVLASIRELTAESEKAITLLHEHRSALISAAVTGQIDVRGLAEAAA